MAGCQTQQRCPQSTRRSAAPRKSASTAPSTPPDPPVGLGGSPSMERRAQRLVILSVPFGGGHRAVADGLRDLLLADPAFRDFDVRVADALDSVTRRVPLARLGAAFYRLITMPAARWLYRLLYGLTDHCPDQVGWCCALLFQARAKRWLREASPSVIISTFPLVTYVVSAALDAGSHTSLMNVVTDGGAVNRSWFGGRADTYLVTDDE